ncbi:hypothetical protein DSL72_003839 [Monilinia vaccinii-corymbosi]|uniref:Uncharacterized protein n=1 Tax=Monilinia vaccinii-corymbosi TaxID=61207 RepID=A0A8A3NUF1_9HELO|nr:hypothetical protein DSL72_003839 [Monilinia vaccinii-corymbosi]
MRTTSLLILLASVRSILGDCNDACAAAITAIGEINVGLQNRSRDCAHFLATTLTPSASIALITTSANIENYPRVPAERTTESGSIPTYASACAASADYASACGCAAITPTKAIAPTPTTYLFDKLPLCPNPATCAQRYRNAACGGGAGICVPDGGNGGAGFCISAGNCGPPCARNSQCASGICLKDTCCGSTCYNPSVQFVTTWAPPPPKHDKIGFGGFGGFSGFNSLDPMFEKLSQAKGKLLGASKNTILGPYVPENPQPKKLFKGWS